MTTALSRLDITAAADASRLVALATVYAETEDVIGADVAKDLRVERKIDRVTARFLSFTDLGAVAFQRYAERVPGFGDDTLVLNRTPIVGVITVEFFPTSAAIEVPPGLGVDVSENWEVMDEGDPGIIRSRFGARWSPMVHFATHKVLTELGDPVSGTEDQNYLVTYEAGWLLPGQTIPLPTPGLDTPRTGAPQQPVPADIEEAVVAEVIFAENARLTGGAGGSATGVKRKKVAQTDITFFSNADRELALQFGFMTALAYYTFQRYCRVK